jgi:hypothetical protein
MKHWIDFLTKRTHNTKRMGKISNSIMFDIQQKEIELQNIKQTHQQNEQNIITEMSNLYKDPGAFKKELETALFKAKVYNNTPVLELNNNNKPNT